MTHRKRIGFTLIELLVVITIIVILLAILLPGIDRAISRAETTLCLTTTRAWSQGMAQYAFDHKGAVLQVEYSRGNFWFHRLSPYMGQPGFARDAQPAGNKLDEPMKSMVCATVSDIPPLNTTYETTEGTGTASFALYGDVDTAWSSLLTRGTYAWNNALTKYSGNTAPISYFGKYSQAPGYTPIMADGMWVDFWPSGTDEAPFRTGGLLTGRGDTSLGRICLDRHDLAVNTSFVDGSAATTRLADLWKLKWHRTFVTSSRYDGEFEVGYTRR